MQGTGYERRSVPCVTTENSAPGQRLDLRWGRLSFARFQDEEFLTKQLKRIEITQGARRGGRFEAATLTEAALGKSKSIRQWLKEAQTKAVRGAAQNEELDIEDDTLMMELTLKHTMDNDAVERRQRELTNALCVLGDLQQPKLAALMATKLKEALRRNCMFPNPVYQLIALRRQLMKSMHEAVAAQHRQRKAALQSSLSIVECMKTNVLLSSNEAQPIDAAEVLSGPGTIKATKKVEREAALGIQVLVSLLGDLHDPNIATLVQRREFVADLLPLLHDMEFLGLSSTRTLGVNLSTFCIPHVAEFTQKIQRFLLSMCPRHLNIASTSPKLPVISSRDEDSDVLDRTNAVNGLIYLAAATGSIRDFLVVIRVFLGANDYVLDSGRKEMRSSLSSRLLLTSSVPSLATVRAEEVLSPQLHSGREMTVKAREASAVRLDNSEPQSVSSSSQRETDDLGDTATQGTLKKKIGAKGLKVISTSTIAGTTMVNLAISHSSAPPHRLLYRAPGNNLVGKLRTKVELKDAIAMENASLSLDMSMMATTQGRDGVGTTSRSEIPVLTARCPKFKALGVQSVLVELNRVKPTTSTRASRPKRGTTEDDDVEDGEVWSCGQNSYGELGLGDTATRKSFERVELLQHKDIIQIGAGNEHTIALTSDGKVLTCGYNDNGQCGQGGTARVHDFREIPKMGETNFSQVHAYNGCEHTILVTMAGRAATCGYNYRGQLGHGNTASESVPKIIRSLESKMVRLVSCSYYHTIMTCEEDGNGQQLVYTFGRNDYGQLGHNDSIDRKVPQQVEALSSQHVVSVACGQYHTIVVTATGKAFAFGKNDYGQLGVDLMENQLAPVQLRAGLEKQECLEVRCGYYHSIILSSGAHLFGFGRNDYGQLGLCHSSSSASTNLQLQQQRFSHARLIEELEGKDIVHFACGCYHTIAVSDNGMMYVFGRNNHGQLGTGDTNERVYPFPIDDFVGKRVAHVAAGFYHTVVLTGGKDEGKNDHEKATGTEKKEDVNSLASNELTHLEILSSAAVQELLDSTKRPELDMGSSYLKTVALDDGFDAEAPAIDPTEDDFRDEDTHLEGNSVARGASSEGQSSTVDAVFVTVVLLAQLDRLCQPFIPKLGSYPTLQNPSMSVIELLTTKTLSPSASSLDVSHIFEGSFKSFGIHTCSATFESLAVLLRHLSTRKLEVTSQLMSCLASQTAPSTVSTAIPKRVCYLQMYLLLACIRILQANLSQLLQSGMAKTIILLSPESNMHKSSPREFNLWANELDRIRLAILQVREILLSLVDIKLRRSVCQVFENSSNEEENTSRIANEAITTLMQGFELFFPCQCLQRQFCLHTMQERSNNDSVEHSCGVLCRRDLWVLDTLPKSKTLLLEPLLRRMTDDALIVCFMPFVSTVLPNKSAGGQVSLVNEVYRVVLERIAADFHRRLGELVAVRSDDHLQHEVTSRPFFDTLGGLQKHLSSWAVSVHEWTMKEDTDGIQSHAGIEAHVASVIDRSFRVDEHDLDRVPISWRCFLEFALETLGQSCEVLTQVYSTESIPSPSHGYDRHVDLGLELQDRSLHAKVLETVEHSIVGQFLPLQIVSLFEFSNHSLFAAALLPTLKTLLRLLDDFNRRDHAVESAEHKFVESMASSIQLQSSQSETTGSLQRNNGSNVIRSARDDGKKGVSRKGFTPSDAMTLPWHYRLEKELAVLTAEMASTLVIGDPYFTFDSVEGTRQSDSSKLLKRWVTSPLFRGGLSSKLLTQSIKHTNSTRSDNARVVQHSPFPASAVGLPATLGLTAQPFTLILPPQAKQVICPSWSSSIEFTYSTMFHSDSVKRFLFSLQHGDDSETQSEAPIAVAATKLCEWVRDSYAKNDPSYRMILRQSQLSMNLKSSSRSVDQQVHENDTRIEEALFGSLLYHNMLASQAYHFALQLDREHRSCPPRSFMSLWQCVAQLRRRVAAKKTEIKNERQLDPENPQQSAIDRILALQQTILDRCKLLLLVDVYDEQEHLNFEMDAGYIAPYNPAFLVSTSATFKASNASAKKHLHATYTDDNLPFLVAFPMSKWKRVRMRLHTMIRWKFVATSSPSSWQTQEILAYVSSNDSVSSKTAIHTLLVDPCRRVSCSVRGLETLWELLTFVSYDSIRADIVHQIAQAFVFQSSTLSMLAGSHSVGFFYTSLQSKAFVDLLTQLTELMADKAAVLMETHDATSSYWILIVLLSAWGVHFTTHQFEFVNDVGILGVIQEMLQGLWRKRESERNDAMSSSLPSVNSIVDRNTRQSSLAPFTMHKQLVHLEDTLWVLFRYICVHFAEQKTHHTKAVTNALTQQDISVPTFPLLDHIFELLYNEAVVVSSRSMVAEDNKDLKPRESTSVVPSATKRSFEIVTVPQRFSLQSKGITCSYDDMISPKTGTPMSPLLTSNEFSVTTWLYINNVSPSRSQTIDMDHFDSRRDLQDHQLICIRGAANEISLYLVLVPDSIDNWQVEVGILMHPKREADAVNGRMWERLLSKQSVAGGKWIHVAVVLEAAKLRLYMNGILDCQCSLSAQSIPIWANGNVDLPFHFGRLPMAQEPHPTTSAVASSIRFLSRSLGMVSDASWAPSHNTSSKLDGKTGTLQCLDGWLSHFRFHNRSLSPIHVRIVFDEKKSLSGMAPHEDDDNHAKVMELHALLILLASSSEGLVHLTSQFAKWMNLIWKTFLESTSAVVQQSALRVLRALMVLQDPLEASKAIVQDMKLESLGFDSFEDVFVQQLIRTIGFCCSKCPCTRSSEDISNAAVVPWSLMIAREIHGSHFSSKAHDSLGQQSDLQHDIELQYQLSKRQTMMLANELSQLLHHLFRCSKQAWKQSIVRVTSNITQHFLLANNTEHLESQKLQFASNTLDLGILKSVEARGCFHFLGGEFQFLRPGVTVEMTGSRDYAQVLALERQSLSPLLVHSTADSSGIQPSQPINRMNTLAYVHIDRNSRSLECAEHSRSSSVVPQSDTSMTWYEKVFNSQQDFCPTYAKVNVDELNPTTTSNPNGSNSMHSGIMYEMPSQQSDDHNLFEVLLEKASKVIPAVYSSDVARQEGDRAKLISFCCLLFKILVQVAGTDAGAAKMIAKPALIAIIAEVAVRDDRNPKHETLYHVEKRVSVLRREVNNALIELGEEGEAKVASMFNSSRQTRGASSLKSKNESETRNLNGDERAFDTSKGTGSQSFSRLQPERNGKNEGEVSNEEDNEGPANEEWDLTQEEEQEPQLVGQDEDEDEEEDEEDIDDEEEDSFEDVEDDNNDDDESRAEFVEELMLMGFPEDWCILALKQTENDIVGASAWIVDNLDCLSKLQLSLDQECDKGRDSSRFNEEEDDVEASDDATSARAQLSPLDSSYSWTQSTAWREGDKDAIEKDWHANADNSAASYTRCEDDKVTAPLLNDKETGRKLFGETYFPFEDGGFLSNTKSRFLRSWGIGAIEMKRKTAPSSPQPFLDKSADTSRSAFEDKLEMEVNQLGLTDLLEQLQSFEHILSVLYTRRCMVTLLHQTTCARFTVPFTPGCMISYTQWLKLLKLVLLRGDQFSIVARANVAHGKTSLIEYSVDDVFSKAFGHFLDRDVDTFTKAVFEACLHDLEVAARSKTYEATLWTHRDLTRSDKIVMVEPGIEVVVWMLDTLLAYCTRPSFFLPVDSVTSMLRRLRCCLGTTNLPVKFVVLRAISRLLIITKNGGTNVVNKSQLAVGEFLSAATMRHKRELIQGRLLFSQYLQSYVELIHVLQSLTGFEDINEIPSLTSTSTTQVLRNSSEGDDVPRSSSPTAPTCFNREGHSLSFDRKRSRSSLLSFAEDGLSVSYSGNEVWKTACAMVSFSTGCHSWAVRIEKSSSPYLFVGVATRQANLESFLGADDQSWGFIGDKALYYQRNRIRAYGEAFAEGDCIGLHLDCEKGELSFSKNGVDLGVAFDNVVGEVCPAVAFYSRHQKISFARDTCVRHSETNESETSPTGEDEGASVEHCLIACEIMANWTAKKPMRTALLAAATKLTVEWFAGSTKIVTTRSGKSLWVDVTRETCRKLGFHAQDRVRSPRGDGVVVGVAAGRLWVEVDHEAGAWFFHPSKLRLLPIASSTNSTLLLPSVETASAYSNPNVLATSQSVLSSKEGTNDNVKRNDHHSLVSEVQSPPFFLSPEELSEYGEHCLWSITADGDLLSVINDVCEISRLSPWNLTPRQLVTLITEKRAALELSCMANILAMPQEQCQKMVIARFALLRFYNLYVTRALPFFDLTWHYFLPDYESLLCRLVSQCRGGLFVCVKNALWTALMEKTANSPKRSDDEYDYPEDLPQLQVNRLKAAAAKCHEGTISSLFLALFGQAFEELHFLPLNVLRMVYSHQMDDGQLRSFQVKFEGEGVDDYGGPYREFFSHFFAELQMLHVPEIANGSTNAGPSSTSFKLDPSVSVSVCLLPFFLPSPNWRNGVGANREKFVLNGALIKCQTPTEKCTLPGESAEEKRQLYSEMFYFLGQMIGICLRTRVCIHLDLAMSVWKQLVAEDDLSPEHALETLKEIDFVAYSLWKTLAGILDELKHLQPSEESAKRRELEEQLEAMDLAFTTVLSDGQSVELCKDGINTAVTVANLETYLDAMLQARVQETQEVMNIVKQGLHSIMPVSALALLTWAELEKRMCGVAEVDVKLLQTNTEYDEDLSPNDEFIQRFWRVLESLESEDKRAFLRFVWARSRLPLGSAQFHQKFKIQALASGDGNSLSNSTTDWMDSQMSKSHTCFFALQLPRYSNDEVCRDRLLYAVRNCVEMDGDFRLADTEMTSWIGISPTDQLRI